MPVWHYSLHFRFCGCFLIKHFIWCTGDEEKSRIVVEYARRFQPRPRVLGTWTVPLKHVIRCAGR